MSATRAELEAENEQLSKKVTELEAKVKESEALTEWSAKAKEMMFDLHPTLIGLSRLANTHIIRELKSKLQKFRNIAGAEECARREKGFQ